MKTIEHSPVYQFPLVQISHCTRKPFWMRKKERQGTRRASIKKSGVVADNSRKIDPASFPPVANPTFHRRLVNLCIGDESSLQPFAARQVRPACAPVSRFNSRTKRGESSRAQRVAATGQRQRNRSNGGAWSRSNKADSLPFVNLTYVPPEWPMALYFV